MLSKILRFSSIRCVALGAILLLSPACSNYLGGKESNPDVIQFTDPKLECLKSFPENIRKYVLNDLSVEQTRSTVTCVQEAAELFQRKTKGSGGDTYKTDELRRFFEKYFSKETTVSKELAQELMRFKKALVGGQEDIISKAEISKLIKVLDVVKDEAVRLQPHIRVLFLQEKTATREELVKATEALRKSALHFVKEVDLPNSTYSFDDAKYLLALFAEYISGGKQIKQFGRVKSLLPLIESLRKVLIGENTQLKGDVDYSRAINNFVDANYIFMGIYYRVRYFEYQIPEEVVEVGHFVEKGMILLGQSFQYQNTREISFTSIDQLLNALSERELIPKRISAGALQDVYKALIARNFDPGRRGDSRGLKAIQKVHIDAMLNEYHMWSMKQSWITALPYNNKGGISVEDVLKQAKALDVSLWLGRMGITESAEVAYLKTAWEEFKTFLSVARPVAYDTSGRFVIDYETKYLEQSWKNLTLGNFVHLLSRGLMQGYAVNRDLNHFNCYMTGSSFSEWYKDYNQLGIELKAFDVRSKNSGERSLLEANLFTKYGNGDDKIDYYEAYDFIALLISGGLFVVDQLQEAMAEDQCLLGDMDSFGFPWMDEECFKRSLRKNVSKLFPNLPHMVRYLSRVTDSQFETFYEDLMTAARISPRQGRVETADIRTFVMMLHYAENLTIQFDKNHDGEFDADELAASAPRFFGTMKQIKKSTWSQSEIDGTSDLVWQEAFVYLVVKGEIPNDTFKMIGFAWKRLWQSGYLWGKPRSTLRANRSSIVRTFRLIKEQ